MFVMALQDRLSKVCLYDLLLLDVSDSKAARPLSRRRVNLSAWFVKKPLEPGQEEVTTVKRGLLGLVNASEQRADGNVPFLQSLVANGTVNNVCMEQCRNAREGETGDPQENRLTSDIIQHGVLDDIPLNGQCAIYYPSPKLRINKSALLGLKGINIRELASVSDATALSVKNVIAADVLWPSARCCIHTGDISCSVTAIETVPFIRLDPSNRSTIYTALLFAAEECKCHNQGSCIVTFDQPPYAKALEIIAAAAPGELDSVTLRLGGFHHLVSFVDPIGFIMSGSGIEELRMQVYAKSSLTYMISGHTFYRAVQVMGPTLAAGGHIGDSLSELKGLVIGNFIYSVCGQCCRACMLLDTFTTQNHLIYMSSRWRNSHLECQHMSTTNLHQKVSSLCGGKNEFSGGLWTDFSIEYDLMSALKTKEGLTRGRGVTESTLAYFLAAFPVCLKLCNALEELSGIKAGSSEQHDDYELSPRPPALFDEVAMRKAVKSVFLQLFSYTTPEENSTNDSRRIVIDGGHLLHSLLALVGNNVTVVASDTDIVVMLLVRATDGMELKVLNPGTNTKCDEVYNVREIQAKIRESKDSVPFSHAVNDCDTTSAFFGKEEVCAAGGKFVIALYGEINVNSLDEFRVIQYTRSIAKQPVTAAFELATLPPTSAACAEHSLRIYHHVHCFKSTVQQWCDNISLNPVDWVWKLAGGFLVPILISHAKHLSFCCAWFPVAVRQTMPTDVNARVLDWLARNVWKLLRRKGNGIAFTYASTHVDSSDIGEKLRCCTITCVDASTAAERLTCWPVDWLFTTEEIKRPDLFNGRCQYGQPTCKVDDGEGIGECYTSSNINAMGCVSTRHLFVTTRADHKYLIDNTQ
ncbi:hypothetical protein PR048_018208, partial [Dryococelus australis]